MTTVASGNLTLLRYSVIFDNRLFKTHLMRFKQLLVLLGALFVFFSGSSRLAAPGLHFLATVSYVNLVFIIIAGVAVFSAALSEEKEVYNLNLLLMAGLTPLSIVLSKAASKLIEGLLLLIVQLPFTVLAVAMGGVGMVQILLVYLFLVSFLFLACGAGVLASVICKKAQRASTLTVIFLLPVMAIIVPRATSLFTTNPFIILQQVLFGRIWQVCCISLLVNVVVGLFLFYMSLIMFKYVMKKHPEPPAPSRFMRGTRKQRNALFNVGRPGRNPFGWKEFYFTSSGKIGFLIRCLIFLFLSIAPFIFERCFGEKLEWQWIGVFYIVIGLCCVFSEASMFISRVFQNEVKSKTLTMLMLLPVSENKLTFSMLAGLGVNLIPAMICLVAGVLFCYEVLFSWVFWCVVFALLYYSPLFLYAALYSPLKDRSTKSFVLFVVFCASVVIFPLLLFLPLYAVPLLNKAFKARLRELAAE